MNGSNLSGRICEKFGRSSDKSDGSGCFEAPLPGPPVFATFLAELDGVEEVDVTLIEMDEKTESLKIVISGHDIDYDALREHMSKQGAVIHSVDQVVVEKKR